MIPLPEVAELLVATLICFAVAALWLSPALFGEVWMRTAKIPRDEYPKYVNGKTFAWLAIFLLVLNVGIHALVSLLEFTTMSEGVYCGVGLWMFLAAPLYGIYLFFERRPFLLFVIYSGYFLVIFIISSALYAMWR